MQLDEQHALLAAADAIEIRPLAKVDSIER